MFAPVLQRGGDNLRDLDMLHGKKVKINSIEEALELLRKKYPDKQFLWEGSVGSYSFYILTNSPSSLTSKGEFVAEMWIGKKNIWWLRIKKVIN